jgi:hypothetical protein
VKSPGRRLTVEEANHRSGFEVSPFGDQRVDRERRGDYLLRRRPAINSRPLESRAMAPVARPGSISGVVGTANAGAEKALKTSANPMLHIATFEIRELNFIVYTSWGERTPSGKKPRAKP